MSQAVRIGAVEYLNTKPLIHHLPELAPDAELRLDLPSRLADQLAAGELDVALIPVIEFFRGRDYRYLPNIAIACRGPVLSVTVFSRVPWHEMRSLALDEGSRTSAALLRVLLRCRFGVDPECRPLAMNEPAESVANDGVLLIGDRAMRADLPGFPFSYDLGDEWWSWTELPFVFAVWAVRPGADLGPVAEALVEAKRRGLRDVAAIAHREARSLRLDPAYCRRYLTNIIRFDLGPAEEEGLRHFYLRAVECGLAPAGARFAPYGEGMSRHLRSSPLALTSKTADVS